jgi:hypothetical protein
MADEKDLLITRLNMLCAQKDAEIASLRMATLIERLRRETGASWDATFHTPSLTFAEPEGA